MTVKDYLDLYEMQIGTANVKTIREIMQAGECVGQQLAYKLTGRPDQTMSIKDAMLAAGCKPY